MMIEEEERRENNSENARATNCHLVIAGGTYSTKVEKWEMPENQKSWQRFISKIARLRSNEVFKKIYESIL